MELNEFLEKFLPNYEVRMRQMIEFEEEHNLAAEFRNRNGFYLEHFPEALQSYTDRICEKQRENCVDVYCLNDDVCSLEFDIRNSEQPKMEELV